ncbi:efflux RND transporter permease subunit [Marinibactrum halimedae]|uniref:Acriflavin resistance protein n=1 Tax=Marinibactrum halimedae TaxID=1444977 RepID=A0AA37T8K1_9GAMM|nr:efflux RND transporter permease subunit [Marinibactrum halimedae]MCD9458702.1 efflux RND transporter permease subunit [Marinibactrum halimedae]GLS25931.1 acriflavin resistance protein [Marinibactrum halimedae]
MKGTLGWFIDNPVAANLLMVIIMFGGLMGISSLNKELFPNVVPNVIEISVPYPGAGPREVEEQICIKIEEAIYNIEGIKRLRSYARLGNGRVVVEVESGYDLQQIYNDIKTQVDAIATFPGDTEQPVIFQGKNRTRILRVALAGNIGEAELKAFGTQVRNELSELHNVDVVELRATRRDEIGVEISEFELRRHNLSFDDVVDAIRQSSINIPAGVIRSEAGDFQLQTQGQAYTAQDFEQIPLITNNDGTRILIGDIATVTDGYEDINRYVSFNGKQAVFVDVFGAEDPDIIKTSEAVNEYVEKLKKRAPEGIEVSVWSDLTFMFEGRMTLLANNAIGGLILVFLILMLFLRPKLAVWVAVGIGTAYMGALWVLPYVGVSINMLSMFAFLLILGIVVDDAIIVGESIYTQQQNGVLGKTGALKGVNGVYKPVLFAVISTMVVFIPMLFLPGDASKFLWSIPAVIICSLAFSLIESFWILPSHLAGMKPVKPAKNTLRLLFERVREKFSGALDVFAKKIYFPVLDKSQRHYPVTLLLFIMAFAISISLIKIGYVKTTFQSNPQMDWIQAEITYPDGYPQQKFLETIRRIEASVPEMQQDPELLERGYGDNFVLHNLTWVSGSKAWVVLELSHNSELNLDSGFIAERWREYIGELPEAEKFMLGYTANGDDSDLAIDVFAYDTDVLAAASAELQELLRAYPGVDNVRDSLQTARDDIDIRLKPQAENMDITLRDVARQVRQGYFGTEAQRVPRQNEDVRVMVRYPESERSTPDFIDQIQLRSQVNTEIPFDHVAVAEFVPGFTQIERTDRRRSIEITADIQEDVTSTQYVMKDILERNKEALESKYPGLKVGAGGDSQEQAEFMVALVQAFAFSVLIIYVLMAIEFKSYLKPLGVLSAVPYGMMGAIFGHWMMGFAVDIASYFGILAAAGVVVNDNLVLIDRINQLRAEKVPVHQALLQAGRDRFRPVILTSITTFIGLVPIMLDNSMQAQFLIPMVASIAFGILFATGVTLLFVPAMYLAGARMQYHILRIRGKDTGDNNIEDESDFGQQEANWARN